VTETVTFKNKYKGVGIYFNLTTHLTVMRLNVLFGRCLMNETI